MIWSLEPAKLSTELISPLTHWWVSNSYVFQVISFIICRIWIIILFYSSEFPLQIFVFNRFHKTTKASPVSILNLIDKNICHKISKVTHIHFFLGSHEFFCNNRRWHCCSDNILDLFRTPLTTLDCWFKNLLIILPIINLRIYHSRWRPRGNSQLRISLSKEGW